MRLVWVLPLIVGCGSSSPAGSSDSADSGVGSTEQLCVDTINNYRASIGLPPYARWGANETCADGQAQADSKSGTPHSAFGTCGESAQNECPDWPGPPSTMITSCLAAMWAEGPGSDFSTHGHYVNMSSTQYTEVACGFYTLSDGHVWATQDFH